MIKRGLRKVHRMFLTGKTVPVPYKTSFSQSAEDIIIEFLFGLRKITSPSFIDIGGYDPVYGNNTYKFYLKVASGVNIDAARLQLKNLTGQGQKI